MQKARGDNRRYRECDPPEASLSCSSRADNSDYTYGGTVDSAELGGTKWNAETHAGLNEQHGEREEHGGGEKGQKCFNALRIRVLMPSTLPP